MNRRMIVKTGGIIGALSLTQNLQAQDSKFPCMPGETNMVITLNAPDNTEVLVLKDKVTHVVDNNTSRAVWLSNGSVVTVANSIADIRTALSR